MPSWVACEALWHMLYISPCTRHNSNTNLPTMSLSLSIPQFVVTGVVLWVLSALYRKLFASSSLDNLPGPPSSNLLLGMSRFELPCCCQRFLRRRVGHLQDLHNRNAWGFHKRLIHEYGPVSVVRGMFGVRIHVSQCFFAPLTSHSVSTDEDGLCVRSEGTA